MEVQTAAIRLELLPPLAKLGEFSVHWNSRLDLYWQRLGAAQKLRGSAYLQDGAIQQWELDKQGRFPMTDDEKCWHFLVIGHSDTVIGCARYLLHPSDTRFDELWIGSCAQAVDDYWGPKLRRGIEALLAHAHRERVGFAELGGWAIAHEHRHTKTALHTLIGSYVWAEMLGHCICSCSATFRNQSKSILQRIGGSPLEIDQERLPPYFDSRYGCEMQTLQFDSRRLPSRFEPIAREIRALLGQSSARKSQIFNREADCESTASNLIGLSEALSNDSMPPSNDNRYRFFVAEDDCSVDLVSSQ